ncbi:MAG TPA: FHA domain-containing protein [Coleofasciculaceae cyanobacterium]
MEIEQRLGLYQVFLKLYEYHRGLLDEILQLEKTGQKTLYGVASRCITGVMQGEQSYLITNLIGGKTQTLLQPQGIWTIGRDRQHAISIPDQRLSRHQAAIQYIKNQGFYLIDLDSTNGSFVNGELIQGRCLLKDGDRIRLSSLSFSFFLCHSTQTLDETPPDILAHLENATVTPRFTAIGKPSLPLSTVNGTKPTKEDTAHFLHGQSELSEFSVESSLPQLSPDRRAEILDRFFTRQTRKDDDKN